MASLVLLERAERGKLDLGRVFGRDPRRSHVAGRGGLLSQPVVEIFRPEGDYTETHDRMGVAAELRALAPVIAGLVGLEPEVVGAIRDHIHFAGEFWNPKTVNHIDRAEIHANRTPGGNHQFVGSGEGPGSGDLFTRIVKFEPPLVTGGRDLVGIGLAVFRHVVGIPNAFQRWDGDNDESENGSTDQADFDERIAMTLLGRNGFFLLGRARFKFDRCVGQHRTDQNENYEGHPARDIKNIQLGLRDRPFDLDGRLVAVHPPKIIVTSGQQ